MLKLAVLFSFGVLASASSGNKIAGGLQHSLLVKDGTLYAMGSNDAGQLGIKASFAANPVEVLEESVHVKAVAAGRKHSLFLTRNGSLFGMGKNEFGQLGCGKSEEDKKSPIKIRDSVVAVAAHDQHSLFVTEDGDLFAMGYNKYGQLGDGTTEDRHSPVKIHGSVKAIAAGGGFHTIYGDHSLFVTEAGDLFAMGGNNYGQLGNGSTVDRHSPVKISVPNGQKVKAVAAGSYHSLFITEDGTLFGMGCDQDAQLGDGPKSKSMCPKDDRSKVKLKELMCAKQPVEIRKSIKSIAAGRGHSVFLTEAGELFTMGGNWWGQLGDGTTKNRDAPVKIKDKVRAISAGSHSTFFETEDGKFFGVGAQPVQKQTNLTRCGKEGGWEDFVARKDPVELDMPLSTSRKFSELAQRPVSTASSAGVALCLAMFAACAAAGLGFHRAIRVEAGKQRDLAVSFSDGSTSELLEA